MRQLGRAAPYGEETTLEESQQNARNEAVAGETRLPSERFDKRPLLDQRALPHSQACRPRRAPRQDPSSRKLQPCGRRPGRGISSWSTAREGARRRRRNADLRRRAQP